MGFPTVSERRKINYFFFEASSFLQLGNFMTHRMVEIQLPLQVFSN